MSRQLFEKYRLRHNAEIGSIQHPWEDRYRVALIYPNTYHQGMSNLGFQTVYQLINQTDDCLCERFFLPDSDDMQEFQRSGCRLFSLESQRPLREFDLIAFSISFENDYLHLPTIFSLADLPLYAADRSADSPLVLFGGVCAFLNPEPLAEIVDFVAVGEAEPILPNLLALLASGIDDRRQLLTELMKLSGVYFPSRYSIKYEDDGTISSISHESSAPQQVERQYLEDLNQSASRSYLLTEATEFGDMSLTEVSRGCSHGCRFCAAGYIYSPPRERDLDNLLDQVETGLCHRNKIGLVGAAVADHSQIEPLQQGILERGGTVSVSSLRLDALTEGEVSGLRDSGLRTAAIAPEAGSQRLRDLINKGIDETQILQAVRLLADGDILNLKLYFLIGLPTETQADLEEILQLAEKIRLIWREVGRKRGQMGTVTLSVNPFIPKPFTPLQWVGMEPEKSLKKKIRFLRSAVSRMPNTELISESIRAAVLQAFLSRGDRRVGRLLPALAAGDNLKQLCRKNALSLDFFVTRQRAENEILPWDLIDSGVRRNYLWQEYQSALQGELSPACQPGCRRCGVCS